MDAQQRAGSEQVTEQAEPNEAGERGFAVRLREFFNAVGREEKGAHEA